jgi:hypothetical protein
MAIKTVAHDKLTQTPRTPRGHAIIFLNRDLGPLPYVDVVLCKDRRGEESDG